MKKILHSKFSTLNFRPGRAGFTLVELLVVMAIIGILVTVGLASYRTSQMKARDARRKSDLKQIQTSLNLYLNAWGDFPASDSDGYIIGCEPFPSTCSWGEKWERGGVVYINSLPKDPLSSNPSYTYRKKGKDSFVLKATLENEKDNDIAESKARCGEGTGTEYVVCQE